MANGFNVTVASMVSSTAEFIIGFSLLFMLMNGVFTTYFMLSSSMFSVAVVSSLLFLIVEGLYRIFFIVLGKGDAKGSVLYLFILVFHELGYIISNLAKKIPKPRKMTEEEKKQKEIADNFKRFIEDGMDQASSDYSRQ